MKKTISVKNKKRIEARNRQNLEVDMEAAKILRTVRDQDAFHFYEAIGKPTGEIARNLSDFLDRVKSVKSESLIFHLQRRDFQNWIEKILGDSKLAEELGRISSSNYDDVRMSIYKTVENRINQLRESSVSIQVEENRAVQLPAS
jgi:predicted lactoylglutathione lyase